MSAFETWMIVICLLAVLTATGIGVYRLLTETTAYHRYNRHLSHWERRLDIDLSLKKVRFHGRPAKLAGFLRKNVDTLTHANVNIARLRKLTEQCRGQDRESMIRILAKLPDIPALADLRIAVDTKDDSIEGVIVRRFVDNFHLFHDHFLVRAFGRKRYYHWLNGFVFAYKQEAVFVRTKEGVPETELYPYSELDIHIEHSGKMGPEGERIGLWLYELRIAQQRRMLLSKKVWAQGLLHVRDLDNMGRILGERQAYTDCHTMREALHKLARLTSLDEMTLTAIDSMTHPQFTAWCRDALEAIYETSSTTVDNQEGVDFILTENIHSPRTVVLISKKGQTIGQMTLSSVKRAAFVNDANKGLIIINGTLSKTLRQTAAGTNVWLLSRNELMEIIYEANRKTRHAPVTKP